MFVLGKQQIDSLVLDRLPIAANYLNVTEIQQAYRQIVQTSEPGEHRGHQEAVVAIWYAVMLTQWLELEKERLSGRESLVTEGHGIAATVTQEAQL